MKTLIIGALPETEERRRLYESMISVCRNFSEEIKTPIGTMNFQGTEKERYERAFYSVKEAEIIIADMSEPSTGQGMEIRESTIINKPLIVTAKENSKVSGLVKSCPNLKRIIYYSGLEDLKGKLRNSLK